MGLTITYPTLESHAGVARTEEPAARTGETGRGVETGRQHDPTRNGTRG